MHLMQRPFRTGLYAFFLRYRQFCCSRLLSAIFNKFFPFEDPSHVALERGIGI